MTEKKGIACRDKSFDDVSMTNLSVYTIEKL
jgi:hypothetical protein